MLYDVRLILLIFVVILVVCVLYMAAGRNMHVYYARTRKLKPHMDKYGYAIVNPCLFHYAARKYYVYRLWNKFDATLGNLLQYVLNNGLRHPSLMYCERPDGSTAEIVCAHPDGVVIVAGYEDPRTLVRDDMLYIFVNCEQPGRKCQMAVCTVDCSKLGDTVIVANNMQLLMPSQNEHARQKNWMPFLHAGQIYLIYSVNPHRILHCDPHTGSVHEYASSINDLPTNLRGGSNAVLYGNVYCTVVHIRRWNTYTHRIYTFRKVHPFDVIQISPEFYICNAGIVLGSNTHHYVQFVSGLHYDGTHFEIVWGYADMYSNTTQMHHSVVDRLLQG